MDRSKDIEAATTELEKAAEALLRAARLIRGAPTNEDDDYPLDEQEYDRRELEEADRERAAGLEFHIPAFVADVIVEGRHPVYAWRRYRHLPQAALAKAAGIDRITLVRIEGRSAKPHDTTLAKLAKALNVPVEALADHWEEN